MTRTQRRIANARVQLSLARELAAAGYFAAARDAALGGMHDLATATPADPEAWELLQELIHLRDCGRPVPAYLHERA